MTEKSTTVRFELGTRLLRGSFGALGAVSPPLAALLAEELFLRPPRPRRARELSERGRPFNLRVMGETVVGRVFGQGPAVYLLHGWGGQGAQLGAFVAPLLLAQRKVVLFDAPAHGGSSGKRSSLIAFARALREVVNEHGPASGLIAHSMGSAAATLAMRDGLQVERAVFVGPASNMEDSGKRFARMIGISSEVLDVLRNNVERKFQLRWADLNIITAARTMTAPLLVIHDASDVEIPWAEGAEIARCWPGAQLLTTRGLGHYRVLRDKEAIARAIDFVTQQPETRQ
jgi:pimeloyl-ACP methyl ester carboxylesterase